jgi:hypothetical protein
LEEQIPETSAYEENIKRCIYDSYNNNKLYVCSDKKVYMYDFLKKMLIKDFYINNMEISDIAFSEQLIVVIENSGKISDIPANLYVLSRKNLKILQKISFGHIINSVFIYGPKRKEELVVIQINFLVIIFYSMKTNKIIYVLSINEESLNEVLSRINKEYYDKKVPQFIFEKYNNGFNGFHRIRNININNNILFVTSPHILILVNLDTLAIKYINNSIIPSIYYYKNFREKEKDAEFMEIVNDNNKMYLLNNKNGAVSLYELDFLY